MSPERLLAVFALFISSIVWAADSPAVRVNSFALSTPAPPYPAIARRYNVSGAVVAKLRVETDGHVSKVEIMRSPADVLSESTVRTCLKWRFKPLPGPGTGTWEIPFQLLGPDEYAFSTGVRNLSAPAPTSAEELGVPVTRGWSFVRLLINRTGKVWGTLVLKSSGDDFRKTREAIISKLKFDSAPDGLAEYKFMNVNLFAIEVTKDDVIKVDQYDGESISP